MSEKINPTIARVETDEHGEARAFVGREAVEIVRLAAFASGIRFEMKHPGMRLTRGPKITTRARQQLGLKGNPASLLAQIEAMLTAQKERVSYIAPRTTVRTCNCGGAVELIRAADNVSRGICPRCAADLALVHRDGGAA